MAEQDDFEFLFGQFRLHPVEGLFRGEETVPVRAKPLALLLYLVKHHGRVVTKAAMLDNVWTGTVVDAKGLKHYVGVLRDALGDDPDSPEFIETLYGRGYRFKMPVRQVRRAGVAVPTTSLRRAPDNEDNALGGSSPWSRWTDEEIAKLFPASLADFPNYLFPEGSLDIGIIAGSSQREDSAETARFRQRDVSTSLIGEETLLSRHVSWDTPRDYVRIVDLAAFIGGAFARNTGALERRWPHDDSLCRMDISVGEDYLRRNLILVGGADTNIYIALAALAFRKEFGAFLPIRFPGDDGSYFTCDQIYSELSQRTYSHLEDSNHMHCGYILVARNPWSPSKTMTMVIGTRATGTQAALLALIRGHDVHSRSGDLEPWHNLKSNNRFDPRMPAKVVRAVQARIIDGHDFFDGEIEIQINDKSRISQRHIITDFEFLE